MKKHFDIVIVGAGISGAVLAERYSRTTNKRILVIDKRNHIGGNCHDYLDEHGLLISTYGPHFFHTNYEDVWQYISQFTEWTPYEHRVLSHVDGKKVPIPVNIRTVNELFGLDIKTSEEMEEWLLSHQEKIDTPKNSEESGLARVGRELYEKMFRNYTRKQWGKDPKELEASVLERIPVRHNFDDRYFTDTYQALPKKGYTAIFEKMLNHPNIVVMVDTPWETLKDTITYEKLFFTGRIDSFFSEDLGKLEYRSLRFEFETLEVPSYQDVAQENYPDEKIPFTRIVEYKKATGQKNPYTVISREYPTWEGEPYYPVPSAKNRNLYEQYQKRATSEELKGIYFVGRLANYKYFNMDQAFKNALDFFARLEVTDDTPSSNNSK